MTGDKSFSYAAHGPKQALEPWEFDLRPLGPEDIEMKLAYCGICHSDIHTIDGDWGSQNWPIVPGHELIGYVTKVGDKVTKFKVGERVGVGAQGASCLKCSECKSHQENYCLEGFLGTYGAKLSDGYVTKGGYAHFQRVHNNFAVKIPEGISSPEAAPLLCAGITTYAPLKYAGCGKGKKVGIIGIGGLGHLGVKLANAMGAHVVALSSSDSKRDESSKLGAHEYLNHTNPEELKKHHKSFDILLCTVSAPLDLTKFLKLIKPHGHFCNVGLPEEDMKLPPFAFQHHISISGTLVGSPSEIEEMLELCAKHHIAAQIEIDQLENVNAALDRVRKNLPRYRIVLAIDEELDRQHRGGQKQ